MENIRQLSLTDSAVDWIETYGTKLVSKDFIGYLVKLDKKHTLAISIVGRFIFLKKAKNLIRECAPKEIGKIVKRLLKIQFMKDITLDPFPEMERYNNIRFNLRGASFIGDYMFEDPTYFSGDFVPDDDPSTSPGDFVDFFQKVCASEEENS